MKKILSPVIVFCGAFLATLLLQKNSFVLQEYDGLFLLSPDYFAAMFRTPFPISGIIGDFLTQFFRFGVYAPLIISAGVTLAFLMLRSILRRLVGTVAGSGKSSRTGFSVEEVDGQKNRGCKSAGAILSSDLIPAVLSCALWIAIAFAPTAKRGVAVVLILFVVWALVQLLFHPSGARLGENVPDETVSDASGAKKGQNVAGKAVSVALGAKTGGNAPGKANSANLGAKSPQNEPGSRWLLPFWVNVVGTLVLVGATFLSLALNGKVKERENNATLRVAAVMSDWDRVLAIATPERAAADPDVMPYAFLALGEKGRLGSELFKYPVQSPDDFDFGLSEENEVRYYFNSILYQTLQCPNEAIHSDFQLATYEAHGQSFLVLRRLLSNYYQIGNYELARKYAAVLSRSTLHGQYARYFTESMASGTPREPDSLAFRKVVPLITRDELSNLIMLGAGGINAPAAVDRVLCLLLLQRDMERFQAIFTSVRDRYTSPQGNGSARGTSIPRYYEEALMTLGLTDGVSEQTRQRYADFQLDTMSLPVAQLRKLYGDTFWLYYMSSPDNATDILPSLDF